VLLVKFQVLWDVMLWHWMSSSSILRGHSAFIFGVKQSSTVVPQNIGTTHPVPQCHIPEDLNPELWDVFVML
jgi:hypothetical protein